jgi:hypothetical protein
MEKLFSSKRQVDYEMNIDDYNRLQVVVITPKGRTAYTSCPRLPGECELDEKTFFAACKTCSQNNYSAFIRLANFLYANKLNNLLEVWFKAKNAVVMEQVQIDDMSYYIHM